MYLREPTEHRYSEMNCQDIRTADREEPVEGKARSTRCTCDCRVLRDNDGQLWRIREIPLADAGPSLVFEAEGVFRRVRHYPGNWLELSDSQLYALSWGT